MKRRSLLKLTALGLAAPHIVRAEPSRVLRFIPQSDVTALDPVWTSVYVTRNHAYMVFDTLYGQDASFEPSPQMAEGHTVEQDGRLWRIRLRAGLRWHDGSPVLARDCVASIRRWARRDGYGTTLIAATDDLSAPDDQTIQFRLSRPFPSLLAALSKVPTYGCMMMPERLAVTDPFKPIPEIIGSGPYRFLPDERVPGAHNAYARFEGYLPRAGGAAGWTAGQKVAHFDRVEWTTIPDGATAAAALARGEQDWWDSPVLDLVPSLKQRADLRVRVTDPSGNVVLLRPNCLQPPFNNPALRRVLLAVTDQVTCMQAVSDDPSLVHTPLGAFPPSSPMANAEGLDVLTRPRDLAAARRMVEAAGYKGERLVLMSAIDYPAMKSTGDIMADALKRVGFNVDYVVADWGTVLQRRAKTEPVEQGGWSLYVNIQGGIDWMNPATHPSTRGIGTATGSAPGWPTSPGLESLREAFFAAPDFTAQRDVSARTQRQVFEDVPFVPVGQYLQPTAYRADLEGVLDGFATFWNVRRRG